jgi:coenzyme F420 hydrogenase subunit beta
MNNIKPVIDNTVCVDCGVCNFVCPKFCISTSFSEKYGSYKTTIKEDECIKCGKCQKVCPVYTWSNRNVKSKLVGNCIGVYSGYALEHKTRKECASGGITTSLLIYLLEKKLIDAAVVATRDEKEPLKSKLIIAKSQNDIYQCKGSVYAPTCYTNILKSIISSGYQRLAIVGLPCHIQAISELCKVNSIINEKIKYKISLVCGHTPSVKGYIYSLKHLHIQPKSLTMISNRGDGWPGYMKLWNDGNCKKIKYGNYYSWGTVLSSPLFTPDGCLHCADATGYLADISISDAWLQKYSGDHDGRNLFLIRNNEILKIIANMEKDKIIHLDEETIDDFVKANDAVFKEKLVVNGYKNMKLRRNMKLYEKMDYITDEPLHVQIFIRLLNYMLRIVNIKNKFTLFCFKTLKYLSEKWITIKTC